MKDSGTTLDSPLPRLAISRRHDRDVPAVHRHRTVGAIDGIAERPLSGFNQRVGSTRSDFREVRSRALESIYQLTKSPTHQVTKRRRSQLGDGGSALSITSTSAGTRCETSLNPSCSWSAVN